MCAPHPASQPSLPGLAHSVLCVSNTASQQLSAAPACSGAPSLSLVPMSTLEFREESGGVRSLPHSLSLLSCGCCLQVCPLPRAGGYHFPVPKRGGSLPLPFIFQYLCAVSWLPASYLNTQRWSCSFVEIQMYFPVSQADSVDVLAGLVPIQLNSWDRLKKGSPTPPS